MTMQPTVFVVDDDKGVRNSIRELLLSVGMPAETYESAQGFLDAFDAHRPGCLVLDVRMANMSGLALEAKLAESQSQQIALEALYQELSRNRDEWGYAEIEQSLLIANQQLQLAGNVKAALIALQNADMGCSAWSARS